MLSRLTLQNDRWILDVGYVTVSYSFHVEKLAVEYWPDTDVSYIQSGTWVLDAANAWPKCEFVRRDPFTLYLPENLKLFGLKVGFDLVNVQMPLKYVEPSVGDRITWVHGNL